MTPSRYAGRHGGSGVDDRLPGPETVDALFAGSGVIVDDPVSFPWHLVHDDGWREPVIVDFRRCSDDDLVALATVVPVLTPDDRVVATAAQRAALSRAMPLPDPAFLDDVPEDPEPLMTELRGRKLRRALVREALEPVLVDELYATVGIEATRPLTVAELGADHRWTEALLPQPHSLLPLRAEDGAADPHEAAAIVVVHGRTADAEAITRARRVLAPGGLIVVVFDEDSVRAGAGPVGVVELVERSTGGHHVVEHVWTLRERPGRPTAGGLLSIRILGAAREVES